MVNKREIDKNAVGYKIHRRRKDLNMTVKQLADQTDLETVWLIQLERGEIDLPVDAGVMYRIAEALDTTIADLYGLPIRIRMPKVYNKRKRLEPKPLDAVYVGRPSKWGNPFRVGRDGNREEVIGLFEAYAMKRLQKEPDWLDELKGKDLVCWCFPEACHADVLLRLANDTSRAFVIRSNKVNSHGFRIVLCKGDMREDGTIQLTFTGNKIINADTGQRERVDLREKYDSMDALLADLETQDVRNIYWQDTKEYEKVQHE